MQTIKFFLLFVFSGAVYSQSYDFSLQIKLSALYAEQYQNNAFDKSFNIFPLGVYLVNKIKISSDYSIEICPGYFSGGENFSGIESGFYIRRNIYDDIIFASAGINFHYNFGDSHGVQIFEVTPDGIFTNLGGSILMSLNKNISFLIAYFKPLNKDYGYSRISGLEYKRSLEDILQTGIEFNF